MRLPEKIALAIPAYTNATVLQWVVDSILSQTHENLSLTVFDNGFPDGLHEVSRALDGYDDERLTVIKNKKNVGAGENYRNCFQVVCREPYGMVLPADIALMPQSLKMLMSQIQETGSEIAYPSAVLFDNFDEAYTFVLSPGRAPQDHAQAICETLKSSEVIEEFSGPLNLGGEYNRFSVFGSLGKGYLFRSVRDLRSRYKFHGWEQQNSMVFASGANQVTITNAYMQVALTGLEKSPGAERSSTDWSRVETILASYETVNLLRNQRNFFSSKLDREKLRINHLNLLEHYIDVYGFHKFAAAVIKAALLFRLSDSSALRFIFALLGLFRSRTMK